MFPIPCLHRAEYSLSNFSGDVVNRHIDGIGNLYQHALPRLPMPAKHSPNFIFLFCELRYTVALQNSS